MNRKQKNAIKTIQAMKHDDQVKTIQAMNVEGVNFDIALDSLIDGRPLNPDSVPGTSNTYQTYASQVSEIYRKYENRAEFGNDQVRAAIDSRTSFIGGEGVSVSLGPDVSEAHGKFIKKFIKSNKLHSTRLMDLVRLTEIEGYALTCLKNSKQEDKIPRFGIKQTNRGGIYYSPVLKDEAFPDEVTGYTVGKDGNKESADIKDAVYVRTGGFGSFCTAPTPKVAIILNEAENYDRARCDMRELNHSCARITPDFKTTSKQETAALTEWLKANKWKRGAARIGTAEYSLKSAPNTSAHDGLLKEMTANLKTCSSVTGIPVHWLGWVDLMSNRATAQELYAMIYNATIGERSAIQDALKEIIVKAMQMYVDAGGELITEYTEDFTVRLPMVDFGRFKEMIDAYSVMLSDGIVDKDTYRDQVPGIDPIEVKRRVEAEEETPQITTTLIPEEEEESEDA